MSNNPSTTVPIQLGTQIANIIVEVGPGNINDQAREVNAAFETAYGTPGLENSGVQVSVNVSANIRITVTDSYASYEDARTSNAGRQRGIERGITQVQSSVRPPGPPAIYFTAANLLGFLPGVSLDALPDDSKDCIVCHEHYAGEDTPVLLQPHF